jgi:aspartate carbamoyltransferase regulatory subunit
MMQNGIIIKMHENLNSRLPDKVCSTHDCKCTNLRCITQMRNISEYFQGEDEYLNADTASIQEKVKRIKKGIF